MNERAEYFAILTALCVNEESFNRDKLAETAYFVWQAGDRVAKKTNLTNTNQEQP